MTGTPHSGPPVPRARAASAADAAVRARSSSRTANGLSGPESAVGALQHGLEHLDGRHLAARERGTEPAGRDLADVHQGAWGTIDCPSMRAAGGAVTTVT